MLPCWTTKAKSFGSVRIWLHNIGHIPGEHSLFCAAKVSGQKSYLRFYCSARKKKVIVYLFYYNGYRYILWREPGNTVKILYRGIFLMIY
jgi:hypothetical protein